MGWNVAIDGGELQLLNALDGGEIGMNNLIDGDIGVFNCIPLPEQTKSVTPSETAQTVTPDEGYALGEVDVAAIPADYVGSGVTRDPAMTASGKTVTAPAGYYTTAQTKDVATGSATTPTKDYSTVNPFISVSAGGLISAGVGAAMWITPDVVPGYVAEGTQGKITVSGSKTEQLPVQAAQTITPSTADQTIASGKYLTGAQTILGDANLLAENIAEDKSIFNVQGSLARPWEYVSTLYDETFNLKTDTTFDSWTASTTASAIKATANVATFVADMLNYEYLIMWETACPVVFKSGATLKTIPIWEGAAQFHAIFRRANSLVNIAADNRAGNAAVNITNAPLEEYWNSSGSHTYTYSNSYGLYPAAQTPTFSDSTANNPTVTVKRPTFNARCSTTYFATARKADIDSEKTYYRMRCRLFRQRMVQFGSYQAYGSLNNVYNNLTPVTT